MVKKKIFGYIKMSLLDSFICDYSLISTFDLELLKELHSVGSVNNLKDRRTDIYDVGKV